MKFLTLLLLIGLSIFAQAESFNGFPGNFGPLRYFESPDSPEKVWMIEYTQDGKDFAIIKITNTKSEWANRAVMYTEQLDGKRTIYRSPVKTGFYFLDLDRLTRVKNSDLKVWELGNANSKKTIRFVEQPAATTTAQNLINDYLKDQEGNPDATKDAIGAAATANLKSGCGSTPSLKLKSESFTAVESLRKAEGISKAFAELCKDEDYKKAIQKIGTVQVSYAKAGALTVKKVSSGLDVQIGEKSLNTSINMENWLRDQL